ncbi:hypothetical protein SVIO_018250 [Streptomyces violaceusniger]|uniref:Beta-ketoacyl synthase N-terminal domain-containing protein n=1 Tax=Streptomyces violaceusniger TaxID=68280 RepID=A0A4D4KRB9_STRVO|nr:hypothetical protein SVIO_018250 [Streptomyces violaceusniger]
MVSTDTAGSPVISAWSAISPLGLGSTEFSRGLGSGRRAAVRLDREEWQVPYQEACLVPGFDIRGCWAARAPARWTGSPHWPSSRSAGCSPPVTPGGCRGSTRAPAWCSAPAPEAPRA